MRTRRSILAAGLAAAVTLSLHAAPVLAQEKKIPVIATFSIGPRAKTSAIFV